MFKKILLPVDIGEPEACKQAIAQAVDALHISHGLLRLIYVRSVLVSGYMDFVPAAFDSELQKECEDKLEKISHAIALPKERVSAVVKLGSVYHEVLNEAQAFKADLIVLGSHRPSMSTYLLGSNAATIARHALCSVLVVR